MNLDGGPDPVVALARLSGGFLSASSVAIVDGCGFFDCFDGAFSSGGNQLSRLQTLPPPFTGSASPWRMLPWRSDEPHEGITALPRRIMFRRFRSISPTTTVLAIVFLAHTLAQAEPQPLLTRHVRDVVANGQAPLVGQLPATQSIHFDMVLALRDRAGLQNFVREVNDPTSPSYHQFLTPQEVTARFGPSQEDWDALVAFAKASGFEVINGSREERDLRLT